MLHGITKPMTVTKQLQNNMNKHNIKNLKLPDETYTMLLHSSIRQWNGQVNNNLQSSVHFTKSIVTEELKAVKDKIYSFDLAF